LAWQRSRVAALSVSSERSQFSAVERRRPVGHFESSNLVCDLLKVLLVGRDPAWLTDIRGVAVDMRNVNLQMNCATLNPLYK
jgi:hypothetical protein